MLRVRTVFTGVTGSPWLNTLYFTTAASEATQAEADAAVAKVGAFWGAVDALMSSSVAWATEAEVDELEPSGALVDSHATTPQTGVGAQAGDILPFAVQGLVRAQTSIFAANRQIKGRIFIPGLVESQSSSGVMIAAAATAINSAAATLAAATQPRWAVWSRANGIAAAVTQATVWSQFAVLRSRRD